MKVLFYLLLCLLKISVDVQAANDIKSKVHADKQSLITKECMGVYIHVCV